MEGDIIMYVAVGKDVEDRRSTLKWALKKFNPEKFSSICVFYVLAPSQTITLPNGFEAPAHQLTANEVNAFREQERQEAADILNDCDEICTASKVPCETMQVQNESITQGIIELVYLLRIRKLVMGAAANSAYSRRKMSTTMSKKAYYVNYNAPDFCHIWFVCKNRLIFVRKEFPSDFSCLSLPQYMRPFKREGRAMQPAENAERVELNRSDSSEFQFCTPLASEIGESSSPFPSMHHGSSPITTPSNCADKLYAQLQQVQKELKVSTDKLHRETNLRQKAEKEALEANLKVRAAEKDVGHLKEELRYTKTRLDNSLGKLINASAQIVSLENETEELRLKVKELEKNLESSEKSQRMYKKICDSLQTKFDGALNAADGSALHISEHAPIFYSEYSKKDLERVTNNFDSSLIIGEGGYGDVYRGFLNYTEVAVKTLFPGSLQDPSSFRREVNVLSNLRHPNLVTLLGTCSASWGLIYEYLPNGSLQDRLICRKNSPPLPWQIRIRIATELCSALNFLHSRKPTCVIHADINPANVLLDSNFVCKLSGFGSCLFVSKDTVSSTTKRLMISETDVYAFGMILLCLLTGELSSKIVETVQSALEDDDFHNVLDHSAGEWPFIRATQLAHLALRCCHKVLDERPNLASDEVWMVLKPSNFPTQSSSNPRWLVSDDQVPSYFICPIVQEIMHDPHFAADGFTYEASAIKVWFDGGHETSPMTNLKLKNRHLTPNHALHSAIQEWRQKHQCV